MPEQSEIQKTFRGACSVQFLILHKYAEPVVGEAVGKVTSYGRAAFAQTGCAAPDSEFA